MDSRPESFITYTLCGHRSLLIAPKLPTGQVINAAFWKINSQQYLITAGIRSFQQPCSDFHQVRHLEDGTQVISKFSIPLELKLQANATLWGSEL